MALCVFIGVCVEVYAGVHLCMCVLTCVGGRCISSGASVCVCLCVSGGEDHDNQDHHQQNHHHNHH